MKKTFKIDETLIGDFAPPYVIAEISANHNGSIENAFKLIQEAKTAGADAVKIQTYTPDTITLNCANQDFVIEEGLWSGRTLYDLYSEAHLPWEWHKEIFEFSRSLGITLFSSPFDLSAIDFLEDLGAPAYKIASFELVDLPLIKYAASTKKPLIISTGMGSTDEIEEAVQTAFDSGCEHIALLYCISGYPAPASEHNLKTLIDMSARFDCVVGLSDHTIGSAVPIASVALGAKIIEKHFTLNRAGGGPDDTFSTTPEELKLLCTDLKVAFSAIGNVNYEISSVEKDNVKFRRSLYFVKDMKKGQRITLDSIRSVRPGYGLAPKFFDKIIGKKMLVNKQKFEPVCYSDFV